MPITQEYWDGLSEKAQWDIKVALRGPDSYYGETLKWFTTSVIRGYCKRIFRVGGTVNSDLKLVILPAPSGWNPTPVKTSWNYKHFVEHVALAAEWLNIPILYIPSDKWHEVMQLDHAAQAAKMVLNEVVANPENHYSQKPKKLAELKRHYISKLGGQYAQSTP